MDSLCILASELSVVEQAEVEKAAKFWNCPVNPSRPESFAYCLIYENQKWSLKDQQGNKFSYDFEENKKDYDRRIEKGKKEPLLKAFSNLKEGQHILDLSFGLGIDAIFLLRAGFQVTAVERNPLLYWLAQKSLEVSKQEVFRSLKLEQADAKDYLKSLKNDSVDAIYFDPMYPHKKKSALPRQEMVLFRNLVGDDKDALEVLRLACEHPVSRVVVKRPPGGDSLQTPHHQVEFKSVRYDIYIPGRPIKWN